MTLAQNKKQALIEFLTDEIGYDDTGQNVNRTDDPSRFEVDASSEWPESEWYIYTDEEADDAVEAYIKDSLWAFSPSFLINYIPCMSVLNEREETDLLEAITTIQQKLCESANPLLLVLVGERITDLIWHAVANDGRGHFLGRYDSEEHVHGEYFIYRTN